MNTLLRTSTKVQGIKDMLFLLKIYLWHTGLFVHLLRTQSVKISTFYRNFLIDHWSDLSLILHICAMP